MAFVLQCDADGCGHIEDVGELSEDQIGTPCPACGASLLTREDYEGGMRIVAAAELLKKFGVVSDDGDGGQRMAVGFHDGVLSVEIGEVK